MRRLKFGLFYYLLSIITIATCFHSGSSLNSDGQTLLSLARHWGSVPQTWNASHPDPCLWLGVVCDPKLNLVVSLDLSNSNIVGELGPEISQLTHLKFLNLSSNRISGTIPPQISNCTRLQYLDLSLNRLSGNIPHTLGSVTGLTYLGLFNNSLNGSLPESMFNNPTLHTLRVSSNRLTGFIPSDFRNATSLHKLCIDNNRFSGNLPHRLNKLAYLDANNAGFRGVKIPLGTTTNSCNNLVYLDMSNNQFVGGIPPELANCTILEQVAIVGCGLTGSIPASFGRFTRLNLLYLSINQLSGNIPPELANLTALRDLELDQNELDGTIPNELGRLNLTALLLFSNRLTGEVPMSIWKMKTLEMLCLYDNRLSGELPVEVTRLTRLQEFTLFDNQFSGVIPQSLGVNGSLIIFDFYNNSFTGPIPKYLCDGKRLVKLVLAFNFLEGGIPSEYGNCSSLKRIILNYSNLTGALPDFVNNPNLSYLDLEGNGFTGQIPSSIGKLSSVTVINLSMNRFSGVIPREIGNLMQLQALDLSDNELEGPLPPQLATCIKLLNFDVSRNSFNGSIPTALRAMSGLVTLDLSENQFMGGIPSFVYEFKALTDLHLGGNPLGGRVPGSIAELKTLFTLNISNSGLTGGIPKGFNKLVMLQQLDVSYNNLTDTLAPLSELRALTDVNVSYNLFTGPIPENLVRFLNSSVYSFMGNPGLCVECGLNNCDAASGKLRRCTTESKRQKGLTKFQTAMVAVGTSALSFAVVIGLGLLYQSRKREKHGIEEMYDNKYDKGDSYLFQLVMEATDDLHDSYIIGRGAHGTVYKASLGPEGVYAVKKVMFGSSKEGSTSMVREIETIGKVRHRNLVKLEDFWMKNEYGLILYKYMHNGSLHDILHEVHPPPFLDWSIRCNIALGTAHGLAYLHFDCDPPIVHRDIKPMNILLDAELEPHISDFGIAKLLDQSSVALMSGTLRGTIGYIAPENAFSSTKSKESDVYSYGVVLLELLTRKRAVDPSFEDGVDIVRWVRSVWHETRQLEEVVDDAGGLYDVKEQVTEMLQLALRCTQTEPSRRPTMRHVVKELEDVYAEIKSNLK